MEAPDVESNYGSIAFVDDVDRYVVAFDLDAFVQRLTQWHGFCHSRIKGRLRARDVEKISHQSSHAAGLGSQRGDRECEIVGERGGLFVEDLGDGNHGGQRCSQLV